ncbi:MAG: pyridoxine 5'-phosphate synthase [Flavobacteriales bacterium]|nr:pyridoxine 5'-phosphate synthase [Flavobacteriales bacterium]
MTKLSVNINKVATLRNARGGDTPNLLQVAKDCEHFGAQGITVHPRPDQRHIRYDDAFALAEVVNTEYNIEGNPTDAFIDIVLKIKPTQVTLVPDAEDVLTSNAGWDTIKNESFLTDIISVFKAEGIRTSIFIETELKNIEHAKKTGADRIELYTEDYAKSYSQDRENAIAPFVKAAELASQIGLGINAGHDLNLGNLNYFAKNIPGLLEVSIGHALISDALYLGLQSTIQQYLRQLEIPARNAQSNG